MNVKSLLALPRRYCSLRSEPRAHHSFAAEFDANSPIELTGTVTKVAWTNPHTFFYIDVQGADGKVENWALRWAARTASCVAAGHETR